MTAEISKENIYSPIPEIIETPYPFVALGDLEEVLEILVPKSVPDKYKDFVQLGLFRLHQQTAPDSVSFTGLSAAAINKRLESRIELELLQKPKIGIVVMDRYIKTEPNNENIFRLEISRSADGNGIVARPGSNEEPTVQLNKLVSWAQTGQFSEILFVDDVLAFGDTTSELAELINNNLDNSNVRILVGLAASGGGWNGVESVYRQTNIQVEQICLLLASQPNEWTTGMAVPTSRDFTIFGGKISRSNGDTPRNYPYFLPFSAPNKSFMPIENRGEAAKAFLDYNKKIVLLIEELRGEPLILQDLVNAGFAIPASNIEGLEDAFSNIDLNMLVQDFLVYSESVLGRIY